MSKLRIVAMSTGFILVFALLCSATVASDFTVSTPISSHTVHRGEIRNYFVTIYNLRDEDVEITIDKSYDIEHIVHIEEERLEIGPRDVAKVGVSIHPPVDVRHRTFEGTITVSGPMASKEIPIKIDVLEEERAYVRLSTEAIPDELMPYEGIVVRTALTNLRDEPEEIGLKYEIINMRTGEVINAIRESVVVSKATSKQKNVEVNTSELGRYYIEVTAEYGENQSISNTHSFKLIHVFFTPLRIRIITLFAVIIAASVGVWYLRRWWIEREAEQARYVFPVDMKKLPQQGFWMGKVAETEEKAWISPKDLTTHTIVSGSTGSGKSVTASLIAEEALNQNMSVVVFDPTAQWTGFVKSCKDQDILEHYDRFNLGEDDKRPYPGLIKEIKSEDVDIDFKNLMKPGEITVFTLDQLTTEQFDKAVRSIVDSMFEVNWEESNQLELVVVFDEVHRLLEKYGGKGGYEALEKACREFRKWGIGLVMCSQVTADFKEAISANIMTEIQMQSKSMNDVERISKKYGDEFAKRISSVKVGTGMIQNPEYNEGSPWFVDFRPTYHNPHKIPDSELEKYHKYAKQADMVEEAISKLEDEGEEMEDRRLELKLAKDKLKQGRFRMAEMYLSTLMDDLNVEE